MPFCYAADLGVPSTIIQGSSTSQMSRTSTQSQHHSLTFPDEVSSLQTRAISESRGWEQHLGLVDSEDHLSTEHLLPQHAGQVDDFGEFSMSSLSSAEWVLSLPDLGSGEVASGLGEHT